VLVHPEVFPPHLTFSTKILLDFIESLELHNKNFLELGCGCGIISILAAKKGANVVASDINKTALKYLERNAENNQVKLRILYSDLFEYLNDQTFDYIIINPPYYPKSPKNIKENAWFCGENFEYFVKLFTQLEELREYHKKIFMILSEDCEIDTIKGIASKNNFVFHIDSEKKVMKENHLIFKIIYSEDLQHY
jgi:release factor glutamine methyltransferase